MKKTFKQFLVEMSVSDTMKPPRGFEFFSKLKETVLSWMIIVYHFVGDNGEKYFKIVYGDQMIGAVQGNSFDKSFMAKPNAGGNYGWKKFNDYKKARDHVVAVMQEKQKEQSLQKEAA